MGVYINDMEMPPDGRYTLCITHDSDGGVHWVIQNQDTLEFLKHGAVTEIQEPYGRLINADAMIESIKRQTGFLKSMGDDLATIAEILEKGILQEIENAPTIIPASKEE